MDAEIVRKYTKEAENAELEVTNLQRELDSLKRKIKLKTLESTDAEVSQLATLNIKLKHRLSILNQAIMAQSAQSDNSKIEGLPSIMEILHNLFSVAIQASCPDITDAPVDIALSSANPKFGDYQCNSALALAQIYKQLGKKVAPPAIGKKIIENVPPHKLIAKLETAGPGFINIYLNKQFVLDVLSTIFEHGVRPPKITKKLKILIDFSAPNIAKEMHVGHLRSTIQGESFSRLFEYLGHDVLRINHLGDWGTQFGMLIAHLQDKFPNYLEQSPPIGDLQEFYKESKIRFDTDEDFKKRAYASVVKLQSFDPNHYKAWQMICDVSRKEFQKIYDRLDVQLIERGESFYQKRMEAIVKQLEEGGFLEEDEGRKIMWGNTGNIPLTVVKSDGGFTYDTSDLATIQHRIAEEKSDWIIYITDAGQSTHFEVIFSCAEKIGILDRKTTRVDHVGFGVVLGEDKKKFKTRSGDTVRLSALLDEGLKRALDKLKEKERDKELTEEELKRAQEAVAYGCIKYADLSHNRVHEYVFSFDKMLEDKGNTAVYLLYAYTRIKSIARNANFSSEKIKELAKTHQISLDHPSEWKLAKLLLRFSDVLLKFVKDLYLHPLCEYVYEVATTFTEFYSACYCIERNSAGEVVKVNVGRILLAEATAMFMERCFYILGLKPVSKM